MGAGYYNLRLRKGTDYSIPFVYKDETGALVNLTGYTARASFRRGPTTTPLLNLSSGSGLTLGGALGTVTLVLTDTQTNTLSGRGVFGIELISSGGLVEEFIEGHFSIEPDIVADA